jgi:hypothetical protein
MAFGWQISDLEYLINSILDDKNIYGRFDLLCLFREYKYETRFHLQMKYLKLEESFYFSMNELTNLTDWFNYLFDKVDDYEFQFKAYFNKVWC